MISIKYRPVVYDVRRANLDPCRIAQRLAIEWLAPPRANRRMLTCRQKQLLSLVYNIYIIGSSYIVNAYIICIYYIGPHAHLEAETNTRGLVCSVDCFLVCVCPEPVLANE
jgi:hypothetical protein